MLRLHSTPHFHWLPTIAAALTFGVAMAAGFWQSGRAVEKDRIENRQAAARDAAVMALSMPITQADQLDGRRVAIVGRFLDDKTVFHDNQVLQRRAGYHVLTPFRAESGMVYLVNRGWIAPGASRAELPRVRSLAAIGAGPIAVEGRIVLPPKRVYEIKPEAVQGRVWQNLDLGAMGKQMGLMLQPVVVRLITGPDDDVNRLPDVLAGGAGGVSPASSGGGAPIQAAGMTAAKHRGYAFQWFSLAALTVGLFLFFTFIDYGQSSRNA